MRALVTLGVLLFGTMAVPARAADPIEILSLTLNGRPTGMVGEFQRCDGQPCAMAVDLVALGLVVPPELANATEPIPLAALADVQVRIDKAEQVIYIEVGNAGLRPTEIGNPTQELPAPLLPSDYGAVLNYDILGDISNRRTTAAAQVSARLFSPFGFFESGAIVTILPPSGQRSTVRRLSSTYTYSNADQLFKLRVGDIVTGALPWSRAVRFGGIQISSDFNLRPDLITYPLPTIESSTVVPGTVSLIANGVQQLSAVVQPGPFTVHVLPSITGAGVASVAVQDVLGRQTVVSLPFYASSDLLNPGLTSYSLEAGLIREGYGLVTDHYTGWAISGSARRGVTDWLTMEAHGEATSSLAQIGIGVTARIGTLGIANVALSGSTQGPGILSESRWGGRASFGFQRVARGLNYSFNATLDTVGYRDIAATRGFSLPKLTVNATMGYQTESLGFFGISYISRDSHPVKSALPDGGGLNIEDGARFKIVNASYSVNVSSIGSFRLNGYRDLTRSGRYGISASFNMLFGKGTTASLSGSSDSGRSTLSANLSRGALEHGDVGFRVQNQEGSTTRRSAEFEYYGRWGRATGGIEQSSAGLTGRVGARGSLAFIDGSLFASDHIDDSFAVVRTGNIGNIPVQYENRPIGTTNSRGQLIVPSLRSYQNNRLSLDPSRLPSDIVVGQTFVIVRPHNGSGVIVDLPVKRVHAAVVRLYDNVDKPVVIGSTVQMGDGTAHTVGYDGEAYLQDLKSDNRLTVTRPDGSKCTAHVRYKPVAGDIPIIGPVLCH